MSQNSKEVVARQASQQLEGIGKKVASMTSDSSLPLGLHLDRVASPWLTFKLTADRNVLKELRVNNVEISELTNMGTEGIRGSQGVAARYELVFGIQGRPTTGYYFDEFGNHVAMIQGQSEMQIVPIKGDIEMVFAVVNRINEALPSNESTE